MLNFISVPVEIGDGLILGKSRTGCHQFGYYHRPLGKEGSKGFILEMVTKLRLMLSSAGQIPAGTRARGFFPKEMRIDHDLPEHGEISLISSRNGGPIDTISYSGRPISLTGHAPDGELTASGMKITILELGNTVRTASQDEVTEATVLATVK